MTISTYAELKTAIADFLNRDDLTSAIPNFIALAEADISREIRHWKMEARSQGQQSSGDEYMQLPSDWLETIRLHLTGSGTSPLDLLSRASMADKRAGDEDTAGTPQYYCHADGQIQLYPTPDADTDVELLYYQKVAALSDSNTTNWLLTDAPDVYLYGSLVHTAPYLGEDNRTMVWAQLYAAALQKLQQSSQRARMSGSGLTMKVRGLG